MMKSNIGKTKMAAAGAKPGKTMMRQPPAGPATGLEHQMGPAVKELKRQHPEKYDDIGPHHKRG